MRTIFSIIIFLLPVTRIFAQNLQPSFEILEYLELMKISSRATGDSSYYNQFPAPENHTMVYQSPEMGLKNRWDLWIADNQKTAVISTGVLLPNHYVRTGNTIVLLADDEYRQK